jgi:mannose-6-phosphate isomerase-like protein (cupin superfamily)/predicted DNA-binding transcriptional regulator AlpA
MNQVHHVPKPWGFEIWWAVTDDYAGKLLHVEQGHRLSLQYHEEKDESCYLLSGMIKLTHGLALDELSQRTVSAGECWRNRPGEIHTIEALVTSVVIEASTPQLDDVVRLRDRYGRTDDNTAAPLTVPSAMRPPRLLDRDQLMTKLNVRRQELPAILEAADFPNPVAYFRGRLLWQESSVDAWMQQGDPVPDVVHAVSG